MWLGLLVVIACGCDRVLGLQGVGPPQLDAPPSSSDTMSDSGICYGHNGSGGTGLLSICLDSDPQPSLDLAGAINTDVGCDLVIGQTDAVHTEVCVHTAHVITVGKLVVTGGRPIVLLGTESVTVTVAQTLDASSHHAAVAGPGAMVATCAFGAPPGSSTTGGGGGAGGSFGSAGGSGGSGGSVTGGSGGGAFPVPSVLRAGCPGGSGGGGPNSAAGGPGGHGGGGVYLVSGGVVTVYGNIDASGGGGSGGQAGTTNGAGGGGGGGGGAGGLIGLDAPHVMLDQTASVFANGGGGGGGGGYMVGGNAGQDPSAALTVATGATSVTNGGAGGNGYAAMTTPTGGGASKAGGGGGGGGGYVLVFTPDFITQAQISPPAIRP